MPIRGFNGLELFCHKTGMEEGATEQGVLGGLVKAISGPELPISPRSTLHQVLNSVKEDQASLEESLKVRIQSGLSSIYARVTGHRAAREASS